VIRKIEKEIHKEMNLIFLNLFVILKDIKITLQKINKKASSTLF
jgi:hypothetical protein